MGVMTRGGSAITAHTGDRRERGTSERNRLQRVTTAREQVMRAALTVCGESGYKDLSVQAVVERTATGRSGFYSMFKDMDECLTTAYEQEVERLAALVLRPATHWDDWRSGVRAGPIPPFTYIEDEPLIAKTLVLEAYAIGGRVLEKHNQVVDRFAEAIDAARKELSSSDRPPPPMTAMGVVAGIENILQGHLALDSPPDLWETLPDMMYLGVAQYFGMEVAQLELRRERTE